MIDPQDKAFLIEIFEAAVAAADPVLALSSNLPQKPKGKTVVVGAGKGAAQLAAAFEDLWDGPVQGVVVTRYGYGVACKMVNVIEAAHPVPDAAGQQGAAALMAAVSGLGPDDLVVALICGGGSALLPAPIDGLTLEDEAELNRVLLSSGAPISIMNAIRKQVSQIKGGRLAALAHPAKLVSLIVSDVPGDDPAQVASGPTVPDDIGPVEALAMADTHRIKLPPRIRTAIEKADPPPKPSDAVFAGNDTRVIASPNLSLEAAARRAADWGIPSVILSDAIEGEAREVAKVHAAIAVDTARKHRPFQPPVVILSGGETTVTLPDNPGRGGRNTEFLLSLAQGIDGQEEIAALAADTDGIDGSEDNAGAFIDGTTVQRLKMAGHDPAVLLFAHDAWTGFAAIQDLFEPGPTGTNVNDFRAILIR